MLGDGTGASLSQVLAVRMAAMAALLSFILMALFVLYYLSDEQRLRERSLANNAVQVVRLLSQGIAPSSIRLYHDYPYAYGFRAYDVRLVSKRHVIASANTGWLQTILNDGVTGIGPSDDRDLMAQHKDLEETFTSFLPAHPEDGREDRVYALTDRVVDGGHKYWVQTFMRGDPGWTSEAVIVGELFHRVLLPVLFIVPGLTLAMFLTTRRSMLPLLKLSQSANSIGNAVARGQSPIPLVETGMVREFADVAATINKMLSKLSLSLYTQKKFIADVAHELRTPLAVLLLEAGRLPEGAIRDQLKQDLKNLGILVNELLRFAQAEEILAQTLEDVDVAAIAQKVSREVAGVAVARNQLIELICPSVPVIMPGNVTLIEIAIRNLVDNALKYSMPQTTIVVSVGAGPTVIVEDSGPGIPTSQRATIFERFWRAHPQSGSGAGVGLALVRRIAELHNGDIRVEDRPGGGSKFTLHFATQPVAI